jgi:hypothetical protein
LWLFPLEVEENSRPRLLLAEVLESLDREKAASLRVESEILFCPLDLLLETCLGFLSGIL